MDQRCGLREYGIFYPVQDVIRWLRNWFSAHPEPIQVSDEAWDGAFRALPLLDGLSHDERRRLRLLAIDFLGRKVFEGAHGFDVTRPMRLVIALQACLLILELGLECYDGWTSIIVYPGGFAPERIYVDEYGVEHQVREELAGEAWQHGPVVLSWDDAGYAGFEDGYNPVIHEFAHKLDMLNGDDNGFPPLHEGVNPEAWTNALSAGFADFGQRCERGEEIGIDDYAATSPGEFFAVISEVFFERPDLLRHYYPDIYDQFRRYYRQDPLARLR